MSDDESVAIVANGLTETLLSALDDDFDSDAHTINETIERVREELRREHLKAAELKITEIQTLSNTRVEEAKQREEEARIIAVHANEEAAKAQEVIRKRHESTEIRIARWASIAGKVAQIFITAGLVAASIVSGFGISHSPHRILQLVITCALTLGTAVSFLGSAWGWSAKDIGIRVEKWASHIIRNTLL
jgi:ABC-type multidrug transport system fused ATPase/permease subunit